MAKEKLDQKKIKFSDLSVKNIKVGPDHIEKDYLFEGSSGFGIRVRTSGTKVIFYKYRFKGKLRFLNLGIYPHISLADARQKYGDAYKLRKSGLDPIEVAAESMRKEAAEELFKQCKALKVVALIEQYIEKYAKTHKKTWHKDELTLAKDVKPAWGNRAASEITKFDASSLLRKVVERGSPGQAQNVLESSRKMFNWAIDQGMLENNPFNGVKRAAPKNKKDRVLSEKEIVTFWQDLDHSNMSDEIRRALKLTLITAQRPGEVIAMHSDEIDGHWWTISGEKTKNEKAHRVYLTDMALDLIGSLEVTDCMTNETRQRGYIFPCPHGSKVQSIAEGAMGYAVRRNFEQNTLTVAKFTPHDLRRTAITNLARLKVPFEWRERIVNHLKDELDDIYNLYEYDVEKEEAMKKWETELIRILGT